MQRFKPLFFLILSIPVFSYAQSNYKPGYIVTLSGDTVKGYIKYENWGKNPSGFNFKSNLTDTPAVKSYSITDATTVVVTGSEIYKRFTLQISRDETTESRLSVGIDKKNITSTIFLKVVNRGKYITLYEYRDDIKDRYFIEDNNGKPIELALNVYLNNSSATEPTREDIYKRQLQALATKYQAGNQDLIAEIQGSDYTKADLENVVFKINGSDNATTFTSTRKFRSRAFAGIGINAFHVSNYYADNFLGSNYNNTYNAQPSAATEVNLGEDIYLSPSKRSMIFRMEVHFTENWGSSIKSKQSDSTFLKYNAHFLSINPQLLFNVYSSNNCDINLGAGIEMYFWCRGYETFVANNYQNILVPVYYEGDFTVTTTANVILNKKFDFNAGYDPVSTIGQKSNTLSAFHFGVNYLFGNSK